MTEQNSQTSPSDTSNLNLSRSSLVGTAGKFSLALLGFLGIIFFYRKLGPTQIGAYYTILAGGKIVSQFQSGIAAAVQKRVSEVRANQREYLGLGLLSWFSFSILALLGAILIFPYLDRIGISIGHLVGGALITSSLGLFATSNQFYTGIGNPGKANWTDALRSLFTLGGQLVLILIGFGQFGLIWGFVFGTTVSAIFIFFLMGIRPLVPTKTIIERTASFAKWSLPNNITSVFYARFDVIVLWWVLGSTSVGFYQPALQLTVPASFVAASISQSLAVKSSGLDSLGESVSSDLQSSLGFVGIISIPVFFGAFAASETLMSGIFGPSAVAGAGALVGLALYQVFHSYWLALGSVMSAVDRPDLNLKISSATLIVNFPLAIFLAHNYGLIGVVSATVIAECFRLLLTTIVGKMLFELPSLPNPVVEQILAGVIMFVIVKLLLRSGFVDEPGFASAGIVIFIGAVVYFSVLISISSQTRDLAKRIL